jgi:periplasmic copper chaperone A
MRFASALAFTLGVLLVVSAATATAHDYAFGTVKVVHPWARATPPGANTGAGYLKLVNSGATPVRLVGGTTPVAQRIEIHLMSMDGGVMRMRPTQGVDISPGATVELKPGGLHLMLIGLKRQLMLEEMVPVTLMFADGTKISFELYVEGMGGDIHNHS